MKKHTITRALALVLILCLCISVFSGAAMASSGTEFQEIDSSLLNSNAQFLEDTAVPEETAEAEYADEELVRIFVVLSSDSAVRAGYPTAGIADNEDAVAYMEGLEQLQNEVAQSIAEEIITDGTFEVNYNFSLIANAFSAYCQYGDIAELETALEETYGDTFEGVYIVPVYEIMEEEEDTASPNMVTAGDMVGSSNAWAAGYTGAGSRIAIIDTGLDTDHPSFDEDAFIYSLAITAAENDTSIEAYNLLDKEEIASVLPLLNCASMKASPTADDLYLSAKIPFAFNYVDETLNVTHDGDTQGDHGTHVAGIAAANRYVPTAGANDEEIVYERQVNGVAGVAPDAQVMPMKVFGVGGGAYTDDYMAAIEDAILLRADSVNLSLGSSVPGKSYSGTAYVDAIFEDLENCDTVVTFSGGNNAWWSEYTYANDYGLLYTEDISYQTGGSPGSYQNAFTVASAVNASRTGNFGDFNGYYAITNDPSSAPTGQPAWISLDTSADGSGTEYDYIFLGDPTDPDDTVKWGDTGAFDGTDVAGKIVLVSRGGGVSFATKETNAALAGAAGIVIYNNVSGVISISTEGATSLLPTAAITLTEAKGILAASQQDENGNYVGKAKVSTEIGTTPADDGYTMSDFSSWGTTGNLAIKPEITAPGGSIYSTLDGTYGNNSGTSMAAPSVAGQAAVLQQYIREQGLAEATGLTSRALTQSLLMATATPLTDPASGLEYSVRNQGAGLGNVANAIASNAYILMSGDDCYSAADGKVKAELGDDPEKTGVYSFTFTLYNLTGEEQRYVSDTSVLTPAVEEYDGEKFMSLSETSLSAGVSYQGDSTVTRLVYDINGDGSVDQGDADALMQYVVGLVDLPEEVLAACDFNSDGIVDPADVYILLGLLAGESYGDVDVNGTSTVVTVPANGSAEVTVTITLSEADRAFFADNYPNGGYVEGYVYLDNEVTLSIPFLAFYGNWTDASMFDRGSYIDAAFGNGCEQSYISASNLVNYLTMRVSGSTTAYYYGVNLFATDDTFDAARTYVLSATNGNSLYRAMPSVIRSTARMFTEITNAETGEVYYSYISAPSSAYYYTTTGVWTATTSSVTLGTAKGDGTYTTTGWTGKDANGDPLPDGTKVLVTCTALPELYRSVAEDGTILFDRDSLGKGAAWTTEITIDNTAPEIASVYYSDDLWGSNDYLTITVSDNRYVAAILLYNAAGTAVLTRSAVNQTTLGESTELRLDIGDIAGNEFILAAVDYAGNVTAGTIKLASSDRGDGEYEEPEPDTNLYAVVTNTDGSMKWSTLDTATVTSTPLADSTVAAECAAYYQGSVYAMSDCTLYRINPETWQTVQSVSLNTTYNFNDFTNFPLGDGLLAPYGGGHLAILDPVELSLGSFDLSSILGEGDSLAAIAYMYSDTDETYGDVDYCFALTAKGELYLFQLYATDTGYGLRYGSYGNIGVTANEDLHSQTLVYDKESDLLIYTVGNAIYNVGIVKSGTSYVGTAKILGNLNAAAVGGLFYMTDAAYEPSGAASAQGIGGTAASKKTIVAATELVQGPASEAGSLD